MFWSRLFGTKTKIEDLDNQKIVALYDTEQQRLIGVFRSIQLATKYLFPEYNENKAQRVGTALNTKGKIMKGTIFNHPVAVRMANHAQTLILRSNACFINQDYPQRMNDKGQIKS